MHSYDNNIYESEKFFKKILNLMPLPIAVTDTKEARILFVNKTFMKNYGYNLEELKTFSSVNLYAVNEDREKILKKLSKKESIHIPLIYSVKSDKSIFPAEIYIQRTNFNGKTIAIIEIIDITDKINAEKILKRYATIDEMTGFYNRRVGLKILEEEFNKAKNENHNLTIGFIDVDSLKPVNDIYGHREGDWLIITISDIIAKCVGMESYVSRLGGDEFLTIFKDYNLKNAQHIYNNILKKIEELNNMKIKLYNVNISYGLAEINENGINSVEDLVSLADERMYQHKKKKKFTN